MLKVNNKKTPERRQLLIAINKICCKKFGSKLNSIF